MFHFTFFKINLDGSLSNREELNHDELDAFMQGVYGKFANVMVKRSDGKKIRYTDNGQQWVKL